jgi:predicted CoA-binding protein
MTDIRGGCELPAFRSTSEEIKKILAESKTLAVVGLSPKPERPSHEVALFMKQQGYRIIPVNPGHSEILGEKCYPRLRDVPEPIDVVDLFVASERVPDIVQDAIAIKAKTIWFQLGVVHNLSAVLAKQAGINVVMNRCMKIEYQAWKSGGD